MDKSSIESASESETDPEYQHGSQRYRLGWIVASMLIYTWLVASLAYDWFREPAGTRVLPSTAGQPAVSRGSTLFELDINTATAGQLQALPDVGPRIAERIVMEREANGLFRSVDELQRVHGMGPKTLDKLRPMLTVGTAMSETTP
ncbi:MAG: ComEA family DNA-binding protein [bacterium]|nr:ComEA family DNA-binding protein [bacterium]